MPGVSLVYSILLLANIIVIVFKGHYKRSMPFMFLLVISVIALLLEVCTSFIFKSIPNNLFFYHFYTPSEFTLFSFFFSVVGMAKKLNNIILGIIVPFIILSFFLSILVQTLDENNSFSILAESILLILYSLLYLQHINIVQVNTKAERNPLFWITMGILIYSIGAFFIEGFITVLIKQNEETARKYYMVGFIFKYIMCILWLVGILLDRERSKNTPDV